MSVLQSLDETEVQSTAGIIIRYAVRTGIGLQLNIENVIYTTINIAFQYALAKMPKAY